MVCTKYKTNIKKIISIIIQSDRGEKKIFQKI